MKKINLIRLWNRLRERFDLTDLYPEEPTLAETVVPITSFDELAKELVIHQETKDLSTAGPHIVWTVPDGERWIVHSIIKPGTVASTKLTIRIPDGTAFDYTDSTTSEVRVTNQNLVLDEKCHIDVGTAGDVSDSSRQFSIIYYKEDAF